MRLDFGSDVLTDEAIAGLVGQTPIITTDLDWRTGLVGRGRVVAAARNRDGGVYATIEVAAEASPGDVAELFEPFKPHTYSLASHGHVVRRSTMDMGRIETHDVGLMQIAPAQAFGNHH